MTRLSTTCVWTGLVAMILSMPLAAQQDLDSRVVHYADMVLTNGKIVTADDDFNVFQAVAVRDGKFLALGTTADISRLAGPKTRRVDLQGNSVVPGFLHTHSHGWQGQPALGRSVWELGGGSLSFDTKENGLEQLRKLAEKTPKNEWVLAYAFRTSVGLGITAKDIDAVVPDHPVLFTLSTYEINLNSRALKMFLEFLGDRKVDGIQLDPATKRPNGLIRGIAAGVYAYEFMPWPDLGALRAKEIEHLQHYTKDGYTTLIGRAPGASVTLLNDIWKAGEMPIRARLTHEFLRDNPEPERFLKRMGNLTGLGDDWLKITGLVVQQPDGGSAAGAILTSLPKLRLGPGDGYGPYGQDRWAEHSNAREAINLAARYGWRVGSVHSYGDKSTLNLLDAYEAASKAPKVLGTGEGLPNAPWVVDHNFMGTEEIVAKMKRLNVMPSVNLWFDRVPRPRDRNRPAGVSQGGFTPAMGNAMIYMYGADRLNNNWGWGRAYIEGGVKPAAELEGSGTALQDIEARITRKDAEGRVWAPQERVSRREALWMKTRWAAYLTGDQQKIGSIEGGKLADFVVLGGDYMTVTEDEIGELPVVMTVVGGKVVHERK